MASIKPSLLKSAAATLFTDSARFAGNEPIEKPPTPFPSRSANDPVSEQASTSGNVSLLKSAMVSCARAPEPGVPKVVCEPKPVPLLKSEIMEGALVMTTASTNKSTCLLSWARPSAALTTLEPTEVPVKFTKPPVPFPYSVPTKVVVAGFVYKNTKSGKASAFIRPERI